MKTEDPIIDRFVKMWVAELASAVEMFSGEAPELRYMRTSKPSIEGGTAVWVKQPFEGAGTFQTWAGAPEATWQKLGGALGEGTPESLQSTYIGVVNQAYQGSAGAINAAFASTIGLPKAETFTAADFAAPAFATFDVEFVNGGIPAMIFAVELVAGDVLGELAAASASAGSAASAEADAQSIRSSLMTLELPVSVSLGHSEVEMKRVLRARPGAVMGLDQGASELVELLVHERVVARGELVLVQGSYGFRVKQILNWQDRLAMCRS